MTADPTKMPDQDNPGSASLLFPGMEIVQDAGGTRYLAMPLSVLRMDSITGFDLYLRAQGGRQFILYRRGDLPFREEHLMRLAESRVRTVFMPAAQLDAYANYIEQNLDEIISDPDITLTEKSQIVYECSARLARKALEQPWSEDHLTPARHVVGHTVKHLLQGSEHLHSMISMLSEDYTTYAHSVNVCVLGLGLAHRLGFSRDALEDLGSGLLLHDVGKARIDQAILHKSTPLSPEEWTIVQNHPDQGVRYLEQAGLFSPTVLSVVHQHHERCNGTGYPRGLQGDQIHIYAKIASLADVFDGLTTARADRPAHPSFEAIQIMQRDMVGAFNAELLRSLVLMLKGKYRASSQVATGADNKAPVRRAA